MPSAHGYRLQNEALQRDAGGKSTTVIGWVCTCLLSTGTYQAPLIETRP